MKEKIIILTPVYNDWKNLTKLLAKINIIFKKKIKMKFDLIIVNDCSTENFNCQKLKLKKINKIILINLATNVGSQRALAIGLKHIVKKYKKDYKTIIIDSDGQDNPNGIIKMFEISKKKPKYSIVVNRGQRKESLWFKFCYEFYNVLIKLFAAKKLRFGNYSLLNFNHVKVISSKADLWSAFPPTVANNTKKISFITINREKRFSGESKMNFFGLLFHAFRVFSVLRYRIIISSIIYLLLGFILFGDSEYVILFYLISTLIFLFNLSNFIMTFSNKFNFMNNFKKAKVSYY